MSIRVSVTDDKEFQVTERAWLSECLKNTH